jgi:hypothetical protein
LQEIPAFEDLIDKAEVDDIRAKVCFKCGITGQQLLLFYYYLMNKIIYSGCDSLQKFAEKLDTNFSCLTETEIDHHRVEINKILKIDNFNDFYKFMNMEPPSKDDLNKKLKQVSKIQKKRNITAQMKSDMYHHRLNKLNFTCNDMNPLIISSKMGNYFPPRIKNGKNN